MIALADAVYLEFIFQGINLRRSSYGWAPIKRENFRTFAAEYMTSAIRDRLILEIGVQSKHLG